MTVSHYIQLSRRLGSIYTIGSCFSKGKFPGMKRTNSENGQVNGHTNSEDPELPPTKRLLSCDEDDTDTSSPSQLIDKMNGIAADDKDIERIAILDFGAQYGKVIDRRVREKNVLSEMFPLSTTVKEIMEKGNFKGIIISGGPNSVYAPGAAQVDPEIFECGLPVLGICYGFQLLNKHFGGGVTKEKLREDGQTEVKIDSSCELFKGLDTVEKVLLTHGDSVSAATVASDFKVIASSGGHVAGIANEEKRLYGVQFHPEVDLTVNGKKIFDNFLFQVVRCKGGYTMKSREQMCIDEINDLVGDAGKVLVMVSGGVDSAVCAALLHKALGSERVTAIHIDNGFMRYKESDAVVESLNALNLNVHRYNCWSEFFSGTVGCDKSGQTLCQTVDPETKRQIIGNTFIRVKDRVMDELKLSKDEYFFAQGTLRPDLIESASALASGHADTIKTHHNDTELVRELRKAGRVIEPLKDFHKDEVRELGASLGLPEAIVQRQPFPGPGLAIRVICATKPFICSDFAHTALYLDVLANLMRIPKNEAEQSTLDKLKEILDGWDLSAFAAQSSEMHTTLLPIKSVGVQGDARSYSYVAALSTAQRPIPWTIMEKMATLIPKVLHNVNRVVYVFGAPVQYPIEKITPTRLNRDTVVTLQQADKCATDALFGNALDGTPDPELEDVSKNIQQMPVVMLPVHFDRNPVINSVSYKRSYCIRPFITADFMTGVAALPGRDIPEKNVLAMAERIKTHVEGTSRVVIDLTSKPPGTTEWE